MMGSNIYIHKEDVWSKAPTKMSSASRDLFEYFYKAIKYTFLNQFKGHEELVGRLENARNWGDACSSAFYRAVENKQQVELPVYEDKIAPLPKENEFYRDEVLEVNDNDYDHRVYGNFEEFFEYADHGWMKSEKGKEICLRLYNCFMQEVTLDKLRQQLDNELSEIHWWNTHSLAALNQYLKANSNDSWGNFLMKYLENNNLINE